MQTQTLLTGIKPTGKIHLGNYLGAIRPTLALLEQYSSAQVFVADYHALNALKDPALLKEYTLDLIATYIACGLDPSRVLLYRQSDIPQDFELATILMSFTEKGLMNRAHAYKAKVDENLNANKHADEGINMGLFTYPILMAADILLFSPDVVPVGKDQVQHLEMARDIAEHVNSNYKRELLKLPKVYVQEDVQTIIGLDGRKMSKSYGNTIPLFAEPDVIRKLIMKIPTTSQGIEESKNPDGDTIFALYSYITTAEEQAQLRERYLAGGMGWGEAKTILFEALMAHTKTMREKYMELRDNHALLQSILEEGALLAREIARHKIRELREAIGIDW